MVNCSRVFYGFTACVFVTSTRADLTAGDIYASSGGERVSRCLIASATASGVGSLVHERQLKSGLLHQVFCTFLFLSAASLFGTIIAQVNEIVADLTTKKKDLDKILESYLNLNPRCTLFEEVS